MALCYEEVRARQSIDMMSQKELELITRADALGVDASRLRGGVPAEMLEAILARLAEDEEAAVAAHAAKTQDEARKLAYDEETTLLTEKTDKLDDDLAALKGQFDARSADYRKALEAERSAKQQVLKQQQEFARKAEKAHQDAKRAALEKERLEKQLQKARR